MTSDRRRALIIGGGVAGPAAALALRRIGIEAAIYEARPAAMDDAGAFLNLAPNGINALKTLGVDGRLEGFPSQGIRFYNRRGKPIGAIDSRDEAARYGAQNRMVKRGWLHKALREAAQEAGIPFEFGKRLAAVEEDGSGQVLAHFEDGSTAQGDLLIGADGLHSRTRQHLLPYGPQPVYTEMVDCGGFSHLPASALPEPNVQHMVFGKRAFFGYIVRPDGEVWWFSNVSWPKPPGRGELNALSSDEWRARLLDLHGDDPAPIPAIIEATPGALGRWAVYDLPPLPTWHGGPVVLVGDAAHAISPHVGQGASLALEDVLVLAQSLREYPSATQAFAAYEQRRRTRVETLVKQARRTGDRKIPHPIFGWFLERMLPYFLQHGADSLAWVYSYRVDWEPSMPTTPELVSVPGTS